VTDIPWERTKLAVQGLVMRRREQWGARFNYTNARQCQVPANDFFLHVAVVNDPGDLIGTEDQVARNIENIGISRFPYTGISYNALAFNTGRLYEAQPLTRRGAHTVNDKTVTPCPTHGGSLSAPSWNLNITVRALCLPQMPNSPVTDAQLRAAAKWAAAQIRAGLAKPTARWHGHRDVAYKDCPGIAFSRIPELNSLTQYYVKVGLGSTPAPTGGSMELTTAVPGLTDPDGTAVTVGEALVRANYVYKQIINGGDVNRLIVEAHQRGTWAQAQVIEGGTVDRRLDALEAAPKA